MVKKVLKIVLLVVVIAFVAIQFRRPVRENPAFDPQHALEAHQQVPAPIAAIFERSCNDCHSNKTVWPMYSQVAPASWLVADDVNLGRNHLNFSLWGTYDKRKQGKKLQQICDEVTDGAMPLSQYTLIHRSAKLSPDDVKAICGWTEVASEAMDKQEPAK
jgi:hypothetical protein